jgi:pseudaminic acid synthase
MRLFNKDLRTDPPIVVAELSGNHNGSISHAISLITAAKEAGADAVKIQCYSPENMTIQSDRPEFIVQSPLWVGKTLWDLYSSAQTPAHWMEAMFAHARNIGIPLFASVFDQESIPELERLGNPAYKVASFEIVDIPLIQAAAKTGKPIIISTGMATDEELYHAIDATEPCQFGVLACTSGYPTPISEANLSLIRRLAPMPNGSFVGLSDHTLGATVPIVATALGAKLIEKHFCLSRSDGGPDTAFSMEPHEFKQMVQAVHDAWSALQPSSSPSEDVNRKYRRSLYVVRDVKAGEPFTQENVRSIRPANGLPPKRLFEVLQRCASDDIAAGTPLADSHLAR